jgi:hypothetical protein
MFSKGLFNNDKNENDKNKDLTEEDYEQINKEISKALSEMKKEKQDEKSDEDLSDADKEVNNFDYDFFSDNSNISNDNFSDASENSFKSANVEMNRNNSLKINMMKNNFKINNNNNNNNNNNINFPQIQNRRNSIEDILLTNSPQYKDSNSFNKYMNHERNEIIQNTHNRSFNNLPFVSNLNNKNLFKKFYLNESGFNNMDNNNNQNLMNNFQKINNNQNLSINNHQIINNNNNFNCINANNNNYFNNNNNNPLNNINLSNYNNNTNYNNNINNNQFLLNNNNPNNYLSFTSISDRGIPGMFNLDSPKNIINLDNILKSRDKRTTLIIRNIPNKYTISLLLYELNKNFENKFDIVYLPKDYINNSNLGFGFINFVNHMHLILFYDEFVGKKWNCFNSKKRCQLAYSKYQGKSELMKYIHTKLGISNLDNNNENIKKSFFINNNKSIRAPIEIPIKYYTNFISFYPFSLCHNKDDKVFIIEKYYNI